MIVFYDKMDNDGRGARAVSDDYLVEDGGVI